MAPLANIHVYSYYPPDSNLFLAGRILHSPRSQPTLANSVKSMPPDIETSIRMEAVRRGTDEYDFADAAEIPDIPFRRSSKQLRFGKDGTLQVEGPRISTAVDDLLTMEQELLTAHRGPINPNSIPARSEKRYMLTLPSLAESCYIGRSHDL